MTGLLFFDTNVLVYAMDPSESVKRPLSVALMQDAFSQGRFVVSPQTLNECYVTLVHRRKLVSSVGAAAYLATIVPACSAPLDAQTNQDAILIERRHRLSWWDCIALASALQARCGHFVSEDLNDGQVIESLTVVNPFASHARATLALT